MEPIKFPIKIPKRLKVPIVIVLLWKSSTKFPIKLQYNLTVTESYKTYVFYGGNGLYWLRMKLKSLHLSSKLSLIFSLICFCCQHRWLHKFWLTNTVVGNCCWKKLEVRKFLLKLGIKFFPMSSITFQPRNFQLFYLKSYIYFILNYRIRDQFDQMKS